MKNIWKGCYLRYDGQIVYVLGTINNIDTGEQLVICRYNGAKAQHYYAVKKDSFLDTAESAGASIPKYRRFSSGRMLSEEDAERIYQCSGAYPPEHTIKRKKSSQHCSDGTYQSYAKDICESYLYDVRLCREGIAEKNGRDDFERAKENVQFLEESFAGALNCYKDYFRERFIEGKSIRQYAAEHGINRGSVDYIQKKFFAALAKCLKDRDV